MRRPLVLPFALIIPDAGVFGTWRLPSPWGLAAGTIVCGLAALLFYYADHRRWVRDPAGKIVADRWQVVLAFAGFRWTRDKANRHFIFSGDTGSGKTTGMNALVADLIRRNPTLGGVVMSNRGDEWFHLEWLANKYGGENNIIRLRSRLVGETAQQAHRFILNSAVQSNHMPAIRGLNCVFQVCDHETDNHNSESLFDRIRRFAVEGIGHGRVPRGATGKHDRSAERPAATKVNPIV